MHKEYSIYDARLIIPDYHHHGIQNTEKSRTIKDCWKNYYSEDPHFFAGNIFINAFQSRALDDFYWAFFCPRINAATRWYMERSFSRPLTPLENSHLVAACWQYIANEEKLKFSDYPGVKPGRNYYRFNDIELFLKNVANKNFPLPGYLGYALSETYFCTENVDINEEDTLPLSDMKKFSDSRTKKVKAIPFIHHLAKHNCTNNPERAKEERRKAFTFLVFQAYDIKKALDIKTSNDITIADMALMHGNYDVYVMLRKKHQELKMAPPALSQLFVAKDFKVKDSLNPLTCAKLNKDIELLNNLLQLPGCEKILNIRAEDDWLTLLEWAVITKNYPLLVSIYKPDSPSIHLALSLAGKNSIDELYKQSLNSNRIDDIQLRDLLQCYATDYPGVQQYMHNQLSHLLEWICEGKITRANLKLIIDNNKNIAQRLEDYLRTLPAKIGHAIIHQSLSDKNSLLGWFWSESGWIDQIRGKGIIELEIKRFDYKKNVTETVKTYQDKFPLPIFFDKEFKKGESVFPRNKDLWSFVMNGEIKKIEEYFCRFNFEETTEFGFSIFLSEHQKSFEIIEKKLNKDQSLPNQEWEKFSASCLQSKKQEIIESLLFIIMKGEITIHSVFAGSPSNINRIRKELFKFILEAEPEKSYEIISASLNKHNPLRELWNDDYLKKLIRERSKLITHFIREAKDIVINLIKNSPYFPQPIEGAEQYQQDSGQFLLTNVLKYQQDNVIEGSCIQDLPIYLFFNSNKFSCYLDLTEIKNLRKSTVQELEKKYQAGDENKLAKEFITQRGKYLQELKDYLLPIKFNFILGKILVCNQALEILSDPGKSVKPDLLITWKKSFPINVFRDSASLEKLVKNLMELRINRSTNPYYEEEEEKRVGEEPPAYNPQLEPELAELMEEEQPLDNEFSEEVAIEGERAPSVSVTQAQASVKFPVFIPGIGHRFITLSTTEYQKLKEAKGEISFQASAVLTDDLEQEPGCLEPPKNDEISYSPGLFSSSSSVSVSVSSKTILGYES